MSKKPKRPSVVDRLAARLYPEGTIDHAMQRKRFVKVVGPAIRLAVAAGWMYSDRYLACRIAGDKLEADKAREFIQTKYGVRL